MYDLSKIRQTYLEAYATNGGNTVEAKLTALNIHSVAEEDRATVASQLSGSKSWEKISEIRMGTKGFPRKTRCRPQKQTYPDFTPPTHNTLAALLAECAELAHEANEDICPLPD